jgi:hypothetical protein
MTGLSRVAKPKATKPQKVKAPKASQPTYSTRLKSLANWFRGYSTSTKEPAPKAPKTSSSFESKAYTTTAQPTGSWYGWFTNLFRQPATIEIPQEVYVKPPTIEQQFIAEPTERPTAEAKQEPIAEEQPEQGFTDTMQQLFFGKDYRIRAYDTNDDDRRSRIFSIIHEYEYKKDKKGSMFTKNDIDDVYQLFTRIGKDRTPIYKYAYKSSAFWDIAKSGIGKGDERFKTLYKDAIDPQSSPEDFYRDAWNIIMGIIEKKSSYKNDLNANEYALNVYKKLNPKEKIHYFSVIRRKIADDNGTFKDLYRLLTVTKPENYVEINDNLYAVETILEYDKKSPDALDFAYKLLESTIGQYVDLLNKWGEPDVETYQGFSINQDINISLKWILKIARDNGLSNFINLLNKPLSYKKRKFELPPDSEISSGDAYKILGLEPNTPFEKVKAKVKTLRKQYHPDYVRGKYNDLINKEPDPEKKAFLETERDTKAEEANNMLKNIHRAFDIIEQSQPSNL